MMKFIYLFLVLLYCNPGFTQDFAVNYHNINISIPGKVSSIIKKNNRFYCYFETDNDAMSTAPTQHFYILDIEGKVLQKIEVPENLQRWYNDFYIKNDTLFTTDYYDNHTFYLNESNNQWIATKKAEHLYYVDKDYTIYAMDFGEWGAVTWFNDHETGKQYEVSAKTPVINKFENIYYLTDEEHILKIENPKKLEESINPYNYSKIVGEGTYFRHGSFSFKGAKQVAKFEKSHLFEQTFKTSFIIKDQLYFLIEEKNQTSVYRLEKEQLKKSFDLKPDIHLYKNSPNNRNPINKNNHQTVQFRTSVEDVFGVIAFDDKKMDITYFTNTFKETLLTELQMMQWFKTSYTNYYQNFKNLTLQEIVATEQKVGSSDLTQRHKITHYLLDGRNIETPRIYRKYEGEHLSLITHYYYSTEGEKIELVSFEWNRHNKQFKSFIDMQRFEEANPDIKNIYKEKYNQLSIFLKQTLGTPARVEESNEEGKMEWQTDDLKILLSYSSYTVELTIYRE